MILKKIIHILLLLTLIMASGSCLATSADSAGYKDGNFQISYGRVNLDAGGELVNFTGEEFAAVFYSAHELKALREATEKNTDSIIFHSVKLIPSMARYPIIAIFFIDSVQNESTLSLIQLDAYKHLHLLTCSTPTQKNQMLSPATEECARAIYKYLNITITATQYEQAQEIQ